ncbi:Putative L,D-transpeptidase YqjB [Halomicronema hongdechloris C2206]|uniref:L,D-transpeptidase YqjB n=1 Tax=Halomicronema hongdechloris C2206 TaxID=1641165 RepID=A0A1Z3HPA5_9CYAN|nr:L,D-transpeptidase [Halomicronema hongdechloris]ASC72131.1 Putative L,D-transpeptidase YqjB [Halomicronema hongdechloris C2206]
MLSYLPITRCFMLLCFAAAGILVMGQRYSPVPRSPSPQPEFLQPLTLGALAPLMEQVPTMVRAHQYHLVVSLGQRRLELQQQGEPIVSYPVAVGQEDWQTPVGTFTVQTMRRHPVWQHPITGEPIAPGPENPLGARWIGFWQDGTYQIGLHGTNQEDSIGRAISHGCIRLRNVDIIDLYDRITLGTPITVTP